MLLILEVLGYEYRKYFPWVSARGEGTSGRWSKTATGGRKETRSGTTETRGKKSLTSHKDLGLYELSCLSILWGRCSWICMSCTNAPPYLFFRQALMNMHETLFISGPESKIRFVHNTKKFVKCCQNENLPLLNIVPETVLQIGSGDYTNLL